MGTYVAALGGLNVVHIFFAFFAAGVLAVGVIVAAISQARVIVSAFEGMSRQPEIAGEIRFTMIIGLAMIESLAIYCLLISLSLLFMKWG